jgi:hypothetical protein
MCQAPPSLYKLGQGSSMNRYLLQSIRKIVQDNLTLAWGRKCKNFVAIKAIQLYHLFLHVSQYLIMEMGKGMFISRIEFVIITTNIHNQVYKKNQQGHLNLIVASSNTM